MNDSFAKNGIRVIGIMLLFYISLVATHKGEFWPFSIYPMFSQAGQPWTRAIVLDVTDLPDDQMWQAHTLSNRISEPIPLQKYGIDQIDYSNFISKTTHWTAERRNALHYMFGKNIGSNQWMVSKVRGHLIDDDSVVVEIKPFFLVTEDTVRMNPTLDESEYFRGEQ